MTDDEDRPARPPKARRSPRDLDTPTRPFPRHEGTAGGAESIDASLPPRRRACLLVLSGPRMGELLPIESAGLLIGRDPQAQLVLLEEGISRRHARVTVEGGVVRLADLGSTNGTWIDGARITEHVLVDGARFHVGQTTVIKFAWHDPIEEQYQRQLLDTALRDGLTRAFNRRYFLERLDAEVAFAGRHRTPLALLLADVDHFAFINRIHGNAAGDTLLRRIADVMQGTIRTEDLLARQAEDTFAVLLRDTGLPGALRLGDRLRAALIETRFEARSEPRIDAPRPARSAEDAPPAIVEVRCSIGAAAIRPIEGASSLSLLASATAGLRRAKLQGRNRVCVDEKRARTED